MFSSHKKLLDSQQAYAKFYNAQPKLVIPKDEWPKEWHIASRYRCMNDHVCRGHTRLGTCIECAREGKPDVPVARTSPEDGSGPFDFEAEMKKKKIADAATV